MKKFSGAIVALVLAIAFYFTLFWGYDALCVLASPTYGLEDVWRSQFIFQIGSLFGLGPVGLLKLAAFFGAVKLVAAGACAVHILGRVRNWTGDNTDSEVLEGGLILVVLISIVSVGPAAWSHSTDLLREHTIQLVLAAVATALCIVERSSERAAEAGEPVVATAEAATWFQPWR